MGEAKPHNAPLKMKRAAAIRAFFQEGKHGKAVTLDELKALSVEERTELGDQCLTALGAELDQ